MRGPAHQLPVLHASAQAAAPPPATNNLDCLIALLPSAAAVTGGEYAISPRPDELPAPPRQTLFFSATWPKEVQAIARQLCRNDPVQVFVGNVQVGWGQWG
jgi:hypothetical protein